jgi:chorismate synthase
MGSSTGRLFRVHTFGESHGPAVGAVVDGCPPGLPLDEAVIQADLDRRRPGASPLHSARDEADRVEILSGVFEGRTLGTPLALLVRNRDADPSAYAAWKDVYRPSHADYSVEARFGHRDWRGGGRASARETVGRVAAGAVARRLLAERAGISIVAWVDQVGPVRAEVDVEAVVREAVEASPGRCPDADAARQMQACIALLREQGDTVGGRVRCVARGVPAGLGEPVYDKLEAELGRALLSLPAAKAVEVGAGLAVAGMTGSACNDAWEAGLPARTRTNHAGGIQGGISNGMPLVVAVAFKPPSTLGRTVEGLHRDGRLVPLDAGGRHDPCVVPRAVPIVEAAVACVLADHWLRWRAIAG